MFAEKKMSLSLRIQPFANLAAAVLILLVPFVLSILFLHVTQSRTKHISKELEVLLREAANKQIQNRSIIAGDEELETSTPQVLAERKRAMLRCMQRFQTVAKVPADSQASMDNSQQLKLALEHYSHKICKLLEEVSGNNNLLRSELFMASVSGLAILAFVAVLYSRLSPAIFLFVVFLAAVRGYLANNYVINDYIRSISDNGNSIAGLFIHNLLHAAGRNDMVLRKLGDELVNNMHYIGLLSWTAVALLISTLSVLCLRGNGRDWFDCAELRRRRNSILFLGAFVSLLYSIAIFRINTVIFWAFSLLGLDQTRDPVALLSHVANGYVQNIAILFSLEATICLSIAILVLNQDINRAVYREQEHREIDSDTWRAKNHLTLNYTKILAPFISAMPAISPLIFKFLERLQGWW